jgi:hypothetical protein
MSLRTIVAYSVEDAGRVAAATTCDVNDVGGCICIEYGDNLVS